MNKRFRVCELGEAEYVRTEKFSQSSVDLERPWIRRMKRTEALWNSTNPGLLDPVVPHITSGVFLPG